MKKLLCIVIIGLSIGCKKDNPNTEKYIKVTYVLKTEVGGFAEITYTSFDKATDERKDEVWNITSPGTFQVSAYCKKGYGAGITVMHPNSDRWSFAMLNNTGDTLAVNEPIIFFPENPTYYYSRIWIGIN